MRFTKKEMYLLWYCFDMNNGDTYVREEMFPEWLERDYNISKKEVEQIFKSLEKKFNNFNKEMTDKEIVQYYGQKWLNVKHMKGLIKQLRKRYEEEEA